MLLAARVARSTKRPTALSHPISHFHPPSPPPSRTAPCPARHSGRAPESRAIRRSGACPVSVRCSQANFPVPVPVPSRLPVLVHRLACQLQIRYRYAMATRRVLSTQAKGKEVRREPEPEHEHTHSHSHSHSIFGSLSHAHGPDEHTNDAEKIVEALKGGGR